MPGDPTGPEVAPGIPAGWPTGWHTARWRHHQRGRRHRPLGYRRPVLSLPTAWCTTVVAVGKWEDEFVVRSRSGDEQAEIVCDLVVHAAGRVPEIGDLALDAAGVERILGAHLFGLQSDEVVNIFGLAIAARQRVHTVGAVGVTRNPKIHRNVASATTQPAWCQHSPSREPRPWPTHVRATLGAGADAGRAPTRRRSHA